MNKVLALYGIEGLKCQNRLHTKSSVLRNKTRFVVLCLVLCPNYPCKFYFHKDPFETMH